jgi:hypothetical protein
MTALGAGRGQPQAHWLRRSRPRQTDVRQRGQRLDRQPPSGWRPDPGCPLGRWAVQVRTEWQAAVAGCHRLYRRRHLRPKIWADLDAQERVWAISLKVGNRSRLRTATTSTASLGTGRASTLGGGQGVVVFFGMAKSVRTPLIGLPRWPQTPDEEMADRVRDGT